MILFAENGRTVNRVGPGEGRTSNTTRPAPGRSMRIPPGSRSASLNSSVRGVGRRYPPLACVYIQIHTTTSLLHFRKMYSRWFAWQALVLQCRQDQFACCLFHRVRKKSVGAGVQPPSPVASFTKTAKTDQFRPMDKPHLGKYPLISILRFMHSLIHQQPQPSHSTHSSPKAPKQYSSAHHSPNLHPHT